MNSCPYCKKSVVDGALTCLNCGRFLGAIPHVDTLDTIVTSDMLLELFDQWGESYTLDSCLHKIRDRIMPEILRFEHVTLGKVMEDYTMHIRMSDPEMYRFAEKNNAVLFIAGFNFYALGAEAKKRSISDERFIAGLRTFQIPTLFRVFRLIDHLVETRKINIDRANRLYKIVRDGLDDLAYRVGKLGYEFHYELIPKLSDLDQSNFTRSLKKYL